MKRAQAWYTDFMVGLLIFFSAIALYYLLQNTFSDETETILEDMIAESKQIAGSLMSTGYPEDWTKSSVQRLGILDENQRIDFRKLDLFMDFSYGHTKTLFRTYYEYVVYFFDGNETIILPNNQTYIGKEPQNQDHLVRITRLVLYNQTIAQMEVQVWQ